MPGAILLAITSWDPAPWIARFRAQDNAGAVAFAKKVGALQPAARPGAAQDINCVSVFEGIFAGDKAAGAQEEAGRDEEQNDG